MQLTIPKYIEKSGVADTPITYIWTKCDDYYVEIPRLFNKINPLQGRSILALTIGFSEWIYWRLQKFYTGQPKLIIDYLEANWAAIVDRRYLNYVTRKCGYVARKYYNISNNPTSLKALYQGDLKEDFRKPIEGPLLTMLSQLGIVTDYTVLDNGNTNASIYVSNVAEAVCNEKIDEFKSWRRTIINRHHEFQTKSPGNYLGVPVPRESIDPDFDYHPSKNKDLINKFLSNLDFESNPFLTHPDELKELGFEGKPYVYEGV